MHAHPPTLGEVMCTIIRWTGFSTTYVTYRRITSYMGTLSSCTYLHTHDQGTRMPLPTPPSRAELSPPSITSCSFNRKQLQCSCNQSILSLTLHKALPFRHLAPCHESPPPPSRASRGEIDSIFFGQSASAPCLLG